MRVIGIDPGSITTGYGIVEYNGGKLRHIDNGGIRPKVGLPLPDRLHEIYCALSKLIETHRPDVAAIENLFVAKNARSSLLLGHARGVAMLAASSAKIEISEYTPSEVKQAVVGNGGAAKYQVQQMVRVILKLPEVAFEDASDALAVAICHCHASVLRQKIERATR